MRIRSVALAGCTVLIAACTESHDATSVVAPPLAPQFRWTSTGCKEGDTLSLPPINGGPDKNGDGWVCAKADGTYYDNKIGK
jgi:hypothetical protein